MDLLKSSKNKIYSMYLFFLGGGRIEFRHILCTSSSIYIYTQFYINDMYWLVVSNMNFIFHNIWNVILPIDFHIFQDG